MMKVKPILLASLIVATGSLSGQEPAPPLPPEVLVLQKQYREKQSEYEAFYLEELKKLKTEYTVNGNLEAALTVLEEIKKYESETAPPPRPPALGPNMANAILYANCDDQFELYLNGVSFCEGKGNGIFEKPIRLKTGDVITVKGIDTGVGRGFACAIRPKNGEPIITDLDHWEVYTPASLADWQDPKGITKRRKPVMGNGTWFYRVQFESDTDCKPIWGEGSTVYFTYEVRP